MRRVGSGVRLRGIKRGRRRGKQLLYKKSMPAKKTFLLHLNLFTQYISFILHTHSVKTVDLTLQTGI